MFESNRRYPTVNHTLSRKTIRSYRSESFFRNDRHYQFFLKRTISQTMFLLIKSDITLTIKTDLHNIRSAYLELRVSLLSLSSFYLAKSDRTIWHCISFISKYKFYSVVFQKNDTQNTPLNQKLIRLSNTITP